MTSGDAVSVIKGPASRTRRPGWLTLLLAPAILLLLFCLLRWSGYWLLESDALPRHIDAAVVLQGSVLAHRTRFEGAVPLLRDGTVDRVLLSIPHQGGWEDPVAPVARQYIERKYGEPIAEKIDMCETSPEVNSTTQEAQVLLACIQSHQWHSVVIVTSEYHTRRTGILWRRLLRSERQPLQVSVYGVKDPECDPRHWWRRRLSAKIWLMESTKLFWVMLGGN